MQQVCNKTEGLALISGVGLVVDVEGVADLDEGGAREGIVGEGIEDGEVVEVVAGGGVELEGEAEDGKAGDLGVGVNNVEGGVGKVGRAEAGRRSWWSWWRRGAASMPAGMRPY